MSSRKAKLLDRLRKKLREKKASLADEFDYKMYILIIYKDPKADPLVFEAEKEKYVREIDDYTQVALWMTNNGEKDMTKHSTEVKDLITRDTVQIHAMRWFALNSSTMDTVHNMDFTVWPNPNDSIASVEALCFSRWKGPKKNKEPYKLLSQRFVLRYYEIRRHVRDVLLADHGKGARGGGGGGDGASKRREIVFNPSLNFAIWVSKCQRSRGGPVEARLTSVMLCIPQSDLTKWIPQAQFTQRLSFEKVTQFQMILWKDLAMRARDQLADKTAKDRKQLEKEFEGKAGPPAAEEVDKAMLKIATSSTFNDKPPHQRTQDEIEAQEAGTLDAMRFMTHAGPGSDAVHSSSSS